VNRKEEFLQIFVKYIHRKGSNDLLAYLESSDFFQAPASTRFHGCYEGGLCEHSVNVWEELVRLKKAYPEVKVSAESAAIVALCHDLCKIETYKPELKSRKTGRTKRDGKPEWEDYIGYSFDEDFAYGGHGSKSVYLVQKHIDLTPEEAVAINCHMGPWDRNPGDYGLGTAYERYPLAWLLHVADESATYIREGKL
jgi:hypothetical protein